MKHERAFRFDLFVILVVVGVMVGLCVTFGYVLIVAAGIRAIIGTGHPYTFVFLMAFMIACPVISAILALEVEELR